MKREPTIISTFTTYIMNISFADFAAGTQERSDTIETIFKYTQCLCEALKHNYVDSAIRGHKQFADKSVESSFEHTHHMQKISELKDGECPIDFIIQTKRKYHRIVFIDGGGQKSVHAFIDINTGDVLKAASWNSPAKDIRYNLLNDEQREWLYQNADYSTGYLYK